MTEFTILFAAAVRAKRRHAGLSQEDLAEKAGCSTDTIGNIERGEVSRSIDVFVSLAKVLTSTFGRCSQSKVLIVNRQRIACGLRATCWSWPGR